MKKLAQQFGPLLIMIGISGALAPVQRAQVAVATRIVTVPEGLYYAVDGTEYHNSVAFLWPEGSRHTLWVMQPVQDWQMPKTRYTFTGWHANGPAPAGNPITVEASAGVTEYRATFGTDYLVSFRFVCGDGCNGGGLVVNGESVFADRDIYLGPGAVTVIPVPKEGYVFTGWQTASGQPVALPQNTITVSGPMTLYPVFSPLRPVTLDSSPSALQVMADGSPITPPYTLQWGANSVHPVDVVSPQMDRAGRLWVFGSWSDGGEQQHQFRVPASDGPVTLTATFVRGITGVIRTSPMSLSLTIDGRNNLPPYSYTWRAGDTHRLEAPAEQTDAQGRLWAFSQWSNGATTRAQDFKVPEEGEWPTAIYNMVGRLTVYGDVSGLSVKVDGTECAVPCEVKRPAGTEIRVSAPGSIQLSEATRVEFTGWTGSAPGGTGDWTANLNGDPQAIWANYRRLNRLTTATDPAGSASWALAPASADGFYDSGTSVAVSVKGAQGYRFLRWEGDLSGITPSAVIPMSAPRSVRAVFELAPDASWAQVLNGAGLAPKPGVAPGSAVSVYGNGLAAATQLGPSSPLRQTLAGMTATVGDRLLPLYFASPTQINLQLPPDLALGKQTLTISPQGMPAVSTDFVVVRNAPGIFTYFENEQDEQALAVALHEDGTLVTSESPARRGELLALYVTGLGPLDHPRPEGLAIPETPPFKAVDPVTVLVGDAAFAAEAAFAAPGSVGVDIVHFRIGGGAPAGPTVPVRLRIKEQESNTVTLPVR